MSSYRSPYLRKTLDSSATDDNELSGRESRLKRDDSTGASAYSSSGYTSRRFAGALRDGSAFGAPSLEEAPATESAIPYSSTARRFRRDESIGSTVTAASTIISPARERVKAALSMAQDEDDHEKEKRKVSLQEEVLNEEDLESRSSSVDKKDGEDEFKSENGFHRQRSSLSQSSGDVTTKRSGVSNMRDNSVDEDSESDRVKIQVRKNIDHYGENEEQPENHKYHTHQEAEIIEEKEKPTVVTKRVPLKRDFTQNSISKERQAASQIDESDWAKRNQGRNKVLDLIAKFSTAASDPSVVSNASTNYKTEHDFSKIGQIKKHSKFQ